MQRELQFADPVCCIFPRVTGCVTATEGPRRTAADKLPKEKRSNRFETFEAAMLLLLATLSAFRRERPKGAGKFTEAQAR